MCAKIFCLELRELYANLQNIFTFLDSQTEYKNIFEIVDQAHCVYNLCVEKIENIWEICIFLYKFQSLERSSKKCSNMIQKGFSYYSLVQNMWVRGNSDHPSVKPIYR